MMVGGKSGLGPRWTRDPNIEKPALEKDMGGWTALVYSKEQQQRLGVDERGSPFKCTVVESRAVKMLFSVIRDKNTDQLTYVKHADRLMNILAEEGLAALCTEDAVVETPCGPYNGLKMVDTGNICAVSIVRSGDILLEAVRRLIPDAKVGKILIQRDEEDPEKKAKLFYSKLPPGVENMRVMLCDPMLATGGSACAAIDVLKEAGVKEEQILFLVTVAAPEGVHRLNEAYPNMKIISAAIDECLNDDKYIVPGLGDFGDRYYGT